MNSTSSTYVTYERVLNEARRNATDRKVMKRVVPLVLKLLCVLYVFCLLSFFVGVLSLAGVFLHDNNIVCARLSMERRTAVRTAVTPCKTSTVTAVIFSTPVPTLSLSVSALSVDSCPCMGGGVEGIGSPGWGAGPRAFRRL